MSRSSFSTSPSRCIRSTVPRISSCADRIASFVADADADQPQDPATPATRSPCRTGPSRRTTQVIGRATSSAIRSGALKATVFGSTSANTTTSTVITAVA